MSNVCTSQSPWKAGLRTTVAVLGLVRQGIPVVGLSEKEAQKLYEKVTENNLDGVLGQSYISPATSRERVG